jgi:hypothetical protein
MVKAAARSGLAIVAAALVGCAIWSCAQPRLVALADAAHPARPHDQWRLDDVVATAIAVVAVAAYAVFATTAFVSVGSQLLAPQHASRIAAHGWAGPSWWRTAVLAACGIGVVVQAASAQAADLDRASDCIAACAPSLDGLPYPDLPAQPHWRPAHPARPQAEIELGGGRDAPRTHTNAHAVEVVVRRGDSLWSISAGLSPPRASDAQIAALVSRLYSANRSAIGPDPDLIYPGTVLRLPGGSP